MDSHEIGDTLEVGANQNAMTTLLCTLKAIRGRLCGMKVSRSSLSKPPKLTAARAMRKYAVDVATRLEEMGCDPITILGLIACGDCVSLGLMTQEEFEADAEIEVIKGMRVIVKSSGLARSAQILEPRDRQRAAAELASYVWPKRQAVTVSNPDGSSLNGPAPQITVIMPDNGRGAPRK